MYEWGYFVIEYLFQILMNFSQTVIYCYVVYRNLLYVVYLVCMCVGGRVGEIWTYQGWRVHIVCGVFGQYGACIHIFL